MKTVVSVPTIAIAGFILAVSRIASAGSAPELDPSSASTAVGILVAGGLLLAERLRRKR